MLSSKFQFPTYIFTTKRVLNGLFTLFTLLTLSAGVVLSGVALMWMYPFTTLTVTSTFTSSVSASESLTWSQTVSFLNLVLTQLDITAALVLGVILCSTFLASLPAILSRSTTGLSILNCALAVDILGVIAGASIIWFRSLQERNTFWSVWVNGGVSVQAAIQDQWSCCGYWSSSDLVQVVPSTTCSSSSVAAALPACVDPFTNYADILLNGVFTFMYGIAGILSMWFLVNVCVIADRDLQKRFKLIDEKRQKSHPSKWIDFV